MLGTIWPEHELKPYHDDMLLVRVRPTAVEVSDSLRRLTPALRRGAPGLTSLQRHERDGLLHHVVPLGDSARRRVARLHRVGRAQPALQAAAREHEENHPHTGVLLVRLRDARHRSYLHRSLQADQHVHSVSKVPARYVWAAPNVADQMKEFLPALRGWNHRAIQLEQAQQLEGFRKARGVHVAVVDSGVDRAHPSLRGRVAQYVHRYGSGHPIKTSPRDVVGHGTHVTGIIAARIQKALEVGGICEPRMTVYKVFIDKPDYDPAPGAAMYMVEPVLYRMALERALRNDIDVMNFSLAGPAPPDEHEASIFQALLDRGTVIVAAMGNAFQHRRRPSFPAAVPGVIAVGAIAPDGQAAPFSQQGPHIALCAPGVAIWSTLPTYKGQFGFVTGPGGKRQVLSRNLRYDGWPGTSMAAPHVTAAVALLRARKGLLTPKQVKHRLMQTADKLPGMKGKKFDYTYGAGRLNLRNLLRR